jgi:hypothetical protein
LSEVLADGIMLIHFSEAVFTFHSFILSDPRNFAYVDAYFSKEAK